MDGSQKLSEAQLRALLPDVRMINAALAKATLSPGHTALIGMVLPENFWVIIEPPLLVPAVELAPLVVPTTTAVLRDVPRGTELRLVPRRERDDPQRALRALGSHAITLWRVVFSGYTSKHDWLHTLAYLVRVARWRGRVPSIARAVFADDEEAAAEARDPRHDLSKHDRQLRALFLALEEPPAHLKPERRRLLSETHGNIARYLGGARRRR